MQFLLVPPTLRGSWRRGLLRQWSQTLPEFQNRLSAQKVHYNHEKNNIYHNAAKGHPIYKHIWHNSCLLLQFVYHNTRVFYWKKNMLHCWIFQKWSSTMFILLIVELDKSIKQLHLIRRCKMEKIEPLEEAHVQAKIEFSTTHQQIHKGGKHFPKPFHQ